MDAAELRERVLALLGDDDDDSGIQALALEESEMNDPTERGDRFSISVDIESWRRLGNSSFVEHFRMERHTFERLVVAVGRHLHGRNRLQRLRTPLDVYHMMVLWILATPDSFRSTAVKFGVSKGVIFFHYTYVIEALREMSPLYIGWPNASRRDVTAAFNEQRYGYPGVVGCIDGYHIRVTAPILQPQRYVNRHHDYSILVQAVCDHDLLFRDVYVGQPGSVGDARTFQRSPLGQILLRRTDVLDDYHLLGDGAYTLTDKVVIPYRDNGNLTQRERTHSYYLARCRSAIERAFARLKGKWKRLKYLPSYSIDYAIDHITACLVLHNFVILRGMEVEGQDVQVNVHQDMGCEELMRQARAAGQLKRDYIAQLLHPIADE